MSIHLYHMMYIKTYEGLFDFFKKKKQNKKSEDILNLNTIYPFEL